MVMPRPTRIELLTALVCGVLATMSFASEGKAVALGPLLGLATITLQRAPMLAVGAVACVVVAVAVAGVPSESGGDLPAALAVVAGAGRYGGRAAPLAVLAMAFATEVPYGAPLIDVIFSTVFAAGVFTGARLVRRRADRARAAARHVAALDAEAPSDVAARVAAEERSRLAGETLTVVRAAVRAMQRDADRASAALDVAALEAVQQRGREAVGELRRLLGLLRAEAPTVPCSPATERRRVPPGALVVLALAAAVAVDVAIDAGATGVGSIALSLALVAVVSARWRHPAAACVAAALPSLIAVSVGTPLIYGFGTSAALVLLAWAAGADGRPVAIAALVVLAAVTVVVSSLDEPGNEAILIVTLTAAAAGGRFWGTQGRSGDASESTAARLLEERRAAAEIAARAERLCLARELHDVASHAVGVMVLQAGAAVALRERDAVAARAAVDEVRHAGEEAVAELDVLFGVLDAGAVGPAGLAHAPGGIELVPALHALVARMVGGGLDVLLDVEARTSVPTELAAVAVRVVQEALTNAARYAAGSRVAVRVDSDETLAIEVRDDGRGTPTGDPGFGLVGLDERVRAAGGQFTAGPVAGGGFAVQARIPLVSGVPA